MEVRNGKLAKTENIPKMFFRGLTSSVTLTNPSLRMLIPWFIALCLKIFVSFLETFCSLRISVSILPYLGFLYGMSAMCLSSLDVG